MSGGADNKVGNWGKWGSEDERGTLNYITAEVLTGAARLVKQGKTYSLAIPLQKDGVPVSPRRGPSLHFMTLDGGDYAAAGAGTEGLRRADDFLIVPCHGTTHIDALAHIWWGKEMYNGFSGNLVTSSGAQKLGIEKMGGVVTRGVMLDICAYKRVDILDPDYVVTGDDILGSAAAQGISLARGDALLLRTAWLNMFYREPGAFFASEPGIGLDALALIARKEISVVAVDNFAVEVLPNNIYKQKEFELLVHVESLRNLGLPLIELVNLEELARDRVYEFLFVVAPLAITGGVASPINPLAVV